jgi:hypothetical protein
VAEEKSKIRQVIDGIANNVIIFLKGEEEEFDSQPPLYTKEEKKELFSIKKDLEKYPERCSD